MNNQNELFISKLSPIIISLASTIVSILLNGYIFGKNDHVLQIPLAQSYQDGSLYPNDPLFAQVEYKSFFWEFLSFLDIYLPLWIVVFVFYFICMSLYYYFAFLIGVHLTDSRLGGFILISLLITPKPGLGFNITSHDIWLSLRVVTGPLLLLSFYLFLQNRLSPSFLVLGISLNLHPISALQMVFIFSIHYLLTNHKVISKALLDLSKSVIVFISAGFPIIIVVLKNRVSNDSQSNSSIIGAPKNWLSVMRIRNGHMVFPFEFSILTVYSNLIIYIFLSIIILKRINSENKKFFVNLFIPVSILFMINLIFSEIIPSVFIIQLQFGRVLRLFGIFVMMVLTIDVHRVIKKQITDITDFFIVLIYTAFVFSTYYQVTVLLIFVSYMVLKLIKYDLTLKNLPKSFRHSFSRRSKQNLIMFNILLASAIGPYFAGNYVQNGSISPEYSFQIDSEDSWTDIQLWVFTHISENSIFITPPHLEGFRVGSQKSIVGEWKDGTLGFFNTSYLEEWWTRMGDFGYTESNFNDYTDEAYSISSFDLISQKYSAKYLVGFLSDSESYLQYGGLRYANSKYLLIELTP